MNTLVKIAKYIGFVVIAIVLLAIPSLLTLSIVFNWGFLLWFLLGGLSLIEVLEFVFIIDKLSGNEDGEIY